MKRHKNLILGLTVLAAAAAAGAWADEPSGTSMPTEIWRARFGGAAGDADSYALYREYQAKGGTDGKALSIAIQAGDLAGTRAVLRHAAKFTSDEISSGYLHQAVDGGNAPLVRSLLAYPGIDVTWRRLRHDGDALPSALAEAVSTCSTESAAAILGTGNADVTEVLWVTKKGGPVSSEPMRCGKKVTLQGWLQAHVRGGRGDRAQGCPSADVAKEMQALLSRAGVTPSPRDCELFGSDIEGCKKSAGKRRRGKGHLRGGVLGTSLRIGAVPAFFLATGAGPGIVGALIIRNWFRRDTFQTRYRGGSALPECDGGEE